MKPDAWTILIDATMIAAGQIIKDQQLTIDTDVLVVELRNALKDNIDDVHQEWKQAVDAKTPEGWLKVMMNTQAMDIALQAVNAAK